MTKYCDERVCVCVSVCPRGYIPTTRAIFTTFLCMLPMAVARSSSGGVTKSQWERVILGIDFPSDYALYSIAFETHRKTGEPIEVPFGMMSVPRNSVLRGVTIPQGEGAILGEHLCPTSLIPLIIANWTGPCCGTRQGQMLDCKRWTSLLSAVKWRCTFRFCG